MTDRPRRVVSSAVDEWTKWTGMEFPPDGNYAFPGGLAPLEVRDGIGRYWEPNVWMLHRVVSAAVTRP